MRASVGTEPGRLRPCGRNDRPAAGRVSHRAEHLPLHVPEPGRPGPLAGDARPGGRAVAERVGASRRVGPVAGDRFPPPLRWPGSFCWNTPRCWSAGLGIGVLAALLAVLPHLLVRATSLPWASLAATLLRRFIARPVHGHVGRSFGPSCPAAGGAARRESVG